jgi:hypothetical protein
MINAAGLKLADIARALPTCFAGVETLIRAAKEGASELKDEDDAGRWGFWR